VRTFSFGHLYPSAAFVFGKTSVEKSADRAAPGSFNKELQLALIEPDALASAAAIQDRFHELVGLELSGTLGASPRALLACRGYSGVHYFGQLPIFGGEIEVFRAALDEFVFLVWTILFVFHGSRLRQQSAQQIMSRLNRTAHSRKLAVVLYLRRIS